MRSESAASGFCVIQALGTRESALVHSSHSLRQLGRTVARIANCQERRQLLGSRIYKSDSARQQKVQRRAAVDAHKKPKVSMPAYQIQQLLVQLDKTRSYLYPFGKKSPHLFMVQNRYVRVSRMQCRSNSESASRVNADPAPRRDRHHDVKRRETGRLRKTLRVLT